jgi:hypothetical protein
MSKYDIDGGFERIERDFYPTPKKAVLPLTNVWSKDIHLNFWEPCAGNESLVDHLEDTGRFTCLYASDVHPTIKKDNLITSTQTKDLFSITEEDVKAVKGSNDEGLDMFITNPPWTNTSKDNYQLFRLIAHLTNFLPTLLLLNANFTWNKSSWAKNGPMNRCSWIKPIGRVKWIEDSKHSGKEDCAWFMFTKNIQFTRVYERD